MLSAMGAAGSNANAAENFSFAERTSRWIALTDAIALGRVLASTASAPETTATCWTSTGAALHALKTQLARLRNAAADRERNETGRGRIRFPAMPSVATNVNDVDFTPYRHFYIAQQREIEANIVQLRTAARDVLAGLSAPARSLCEIDGALQAALAERERTLLAGIPRQLERRFAALRDSAPQNAGTSDWVAPGGWLATFRDEMLATLEAELELRLQPVTGLLETLENTIETTGIAPPQ